MKTTFLNSFVVLAYVALPYSVYGQEKSLNELVLWERTEFLYVDVSSVNLAVNEDAELVEFFDQLASNNSGSPLEQYYDFDLSTYPDGLDVFQVFMLKNWITVYSGSEANIRASKLLEILSSFEGLYGVIELGDYLIDNSSGDWTVSPESQITGSFVQVSTTSDVCTSFFVVTPTNLSRPVDGVNAIFFIEDNSDVVTCFNRLFFDLIGLRGIATQVDIDTGVRDSALSDINDLPNNYLFDFK